jgi:hypothetical protein
MMRTVQDGRGVTWICLELPEVPLDQRASAALMPVDTVAVECNSGAERVIVLLSPGWDDDLDDARLVRTIGDALA